MQLFYVQCQHLQSMQEVVCPLRSEAGSEGVEDEVDSHKNTIHVQFFFFSTVITIFLFLYQVLWWSDILVA